MGGGSVTINGGDINFPETKYGIYSNAITIDGAGVTVNATMNAFYAATDITILNSDVTAKANNIVILFGGAVTIRDSKIDISNYTKNRCTSGIGSVDNTSSVTIENSSLSAVLCQYGIKIKGDITINGGNVSAPGMYEGITSQNGNISLSWSTATDSIHTNRYTAAGTVTLEKQFDNGMTVIPAGTVSDLTTINSKTLTPPYVFDITVSDCENGTVKAPTKAIEGDTVTLTVTPDEGYALKTLTVNGTAIEPVNGVYSFTMPAQNVTVSASFSAIGDVNLDGHLTIRDVTAIRRHVAEYVIIPDDYLVLADTDGDGDVDINDTTYLQMYLAEYDVVLGKQT